MIEKVELLMKPVCACGYVFNNLRMYRNTIPLAGVPIVCPQYVRDYRFDPARCPSCGRWIESLVIRGFPDPDRSDVDEVIFSSENNEPKIIKEEW